MPDPSDPKRPRLVFPGSDADSAPARRIVSPGADAAAAPGPEAPAPTRRPGLILPPGAGREVPEDLPEYPRLRPLGLARVSDGRREMLLVSDPTGVIQGQPALSMEALPMLQLLDGTTSLTDITSTLMRGSKDLRVASLVRDFVARLDQMLLLDSPRFHQALQMLRDRYHQLEIRPAALENQAYPGQRAELEAFLDDHFAEAAAMRERAVPPAAAQPTDARSATAPAAPPRAILSPHLDPRRAGAVIARAMAEIGPRQARPLRVVIFGTGHSLLDDLFALTRKHFETPLGKARCDTAFVDRVASRLGESAYRGELAHRDEHSIEFQVIYLLRLLKEHPFTIVPILCGGFHSLLAEGQTAREAPEFERLIEAVREAERELSGRTLYIAGVDFSHVGPRFGHPPIDARVKDETEAVDRAGLTAALAGDAEGWFRAIAAQDDRTNICGFAPTYAMLRCADVTDGRLLHYEQCDEPDGSTVTVAAAVWG
jgi:AmmeMemoRadiSam system protein B